MTSGMDLALALIEEDCGRTLAMEVARHMVLYLRRSAASRNSACISRRSFPTWPSAGCSNGRRRCNPTCASGYGGARDELAQPARVPRADRHDAGQIRRRSHGYIATCNLLEDTDREQKEVASLSGLGSETNLHGVHDPARHHQPYTPSALGPPQAKPLAISAMTMTPGSTTRK